MRLFYVMKKLVPFLLLMFILSFSAATADSKFTCENCVKDAEAYRCSNVCTFRFQSADGEKALRLSSGASVVISEKTGLPETVRYASEPKEPQSINGYLV